MSDFLLTRQLRDEGFAPGEIERRVRNGELQRLRRGAYGALLEDDDARRAHRRLVASTLAQGHPRSVVSHQSAAVLHGLPVRQTSLDRVHLTRSRQGGGQRRQWLQVHGHPLQEQEVVEVGGVRLTSVARTFVDLACRVPLGEAVALGDAALRAGTSPEALADALVRVGPRHGIGAARRAARLLDPASESYGESVSRVVMHEHGLPAPLLQLPVLDRDGALVGRCDFAWSRLGTLGEFDGKIKYGRDLNPGADLTEVLFQEKVREDRLRELGWQVVRWTWSDVLDPPAWLARLTRAFARGRTSARPYGVRSPLA